MLVPLLLLALEGPAITISTASLEPPNGVVSFTLDPQSDLDWRAIAETKFASHSLDQPSKETLEELSQKRDTSDGAERRFEYAAPEELTKKFHYLISSQGALLLHVDKLRGVIGYLFEHQRRALQSVSFSGSVLAELPKQEGLSAGFVFSSAQALKIESTPVSADAVRVRKTGSVFHVRYEDGGRVLEGETEAIMPSPEVKAALLFRTAPGSPSYLFVQWKPDPDACEFAFSLFLVEAGGLKAVKWTAYGCDV